MKPLGKERALWYAPPPSRGRTFGPNMRAPIAIAIVVALAAASSGCRDAARARKVLEPYTLVPGTPTADSAKPQIERDFADGGGAYGINVPRQCDLYRQLSVRKVDILWVVDSSGSMAPKQARLAANFFGFINQLVTANPPIDFHIAVASTDTDDNGARGTLRTWNQGGLTGNYIACVPQVSGGLLCNTSPSVDGGTSSATGAFTQLSSVGTSGSAQERGLYAAYLALTNPANISTATSEQFIRADAALYVVVVSDEDDASCFPLTDQPICTADPGCRCAPDTALAGVGAWGSTSYFTRFLETYKGYGNEDLTALAAIVALNDGPDAGVPSQFGDPRFHSGCCRNLAGGACPTGGTNDGGFEIAYFGGRYIKVAAETGGVSVDICAPDFSGALANLGYRASGLRREFRLSRGPEVKAQGGVATGLELYIAPAAAASCTVDGNCPAGQFCRSKKCAVKVAVSTTPATNGAAYARCEGTSLRNVVRFDGTAVPESLAQVEVCYDVKTDFSNTCP